MKRAAEAIKVIFPATMNICTIKEDLKSMKVIFQATILRSIVIFHVVLTLLT